MLALVTGGAGFIGSHLCEKLLAEGHHIIAVDDLNDSYSPDLKRANLESVRGSGPLRFHQCDICDGGRLFDILEAERPDVAVHLAGRVGVRASLKEPSLYERVNVGGTLNLLEACRRHGVPKFIFGSSSSVYGAASRFPSSEDDHNLLPISPYAATKLAAEKLCYTYAYLYGIQVICLRFFTVYGPRQRPDLAIRRFTDMIDIGEPIPVYGDGSSARDYTYVEDIVQGIMASLTYETDYDVFNLGNSHPVQLRTVVAMLEERLRKPARIERLPPQPGDAPVTCADISKARRYLNYSPQVSLADGLDRFVRWYRSQQVSGSPRLAEGKPEMRARALSWT